MPPDPRLAVSDGRTRSVRARSIALASLAAAGGLWVAQPLDGWLIANLFLLGIPALIVVTTLRELVRIGVAYAFGFEIFGVQWGAGRSLARFRIGQIHFRVAPIPIGADARLASSRPLHHRLARWSLAITPVLCQMLAVVLVSFMAEPSIPSMREGWAPVIVLHLANILLLGLHLFIPFKTESGLCSDLEGMAVLAVLGTDEHRASRATAFAMRVERLLAAARLDLARIELSKAIKQLGREPMLIQLEDRMARIHAAPDPDHAAREEANSDPFEHPRAVWDRTFQQASFSGRFAHRVLGLVPMALLAGAFIAFQFDALLASVHERWTSEAQAIARKSDEGKCREQLALLDDRLERAAALFLIPRELQIRELRARAALHGCSHDFERAARDQALAVQIAETLRDAAPSKRPPDSRGEIVEAELVLSAELRQLAAWHAARGAYRDALRTTARAAQGLKIADLDATSWPPSPERARALQLFERERQILETTRTRIIDGMGVRG